MSLLTLTLPIMGQPDSTEDPKVNNALSAIQTLLNGNLDATNFAPTQGVYSARPAAGVVGRLYHSSDTGHLDYDTGSSWQTVGGWRSWRAVGDGSGDGANGAAPGAWSSTGSPVLHVNSLGVLIPGQYYKLTASFSVGSGNQPAQGGRPLTSSYMATFDGANVIQAMYGAVSVPTNNVALFGFEYGQTTVTIHSYVASLPAGGIYSICLANQQANQISYLKNSSGTIPVITIEEIPPPWTSG